MVDRNTKILEILAMRQRVKVTSLAEVLDVSQVTVRKDLDNLEEKGLIRRIHGYASLDEADNVGKRMAYNYSIKRRIARAAVANVKQGETVMLESGSCCAFMAEELALSQKNVTIITNSAFIANHVRFKPYINIILLGGFYQPESQVMVGPMTVKCGEIFYTDKFYIGADGFMPNYGFTGRDHMRAITAIDLAGRAKEVFVLTDAPKFLSQGVIGLIPFDKITGVYTDEGIPKDAEEVLQKNKISVCKVPVNEVENTQ